jgi:hypothetical protein
MEDLLLKTVALQGRLTGGDLFHFRGLKIDVSAEKDSIRKLN